MPIRPGMVIRVDAVISARITRTGVLKRSTVRTCVTNYIINKQKSQTRSIEDVRSARKQSHSRRKKVVQCGNENYEKCAKIEKD